MKLSNCEILNATYMKSLYNNKLFKMCIVLHLRFKCYFDSLKNNNVTIFVHLVIQHVFILIFSTLVFYLIATISTGGCQKHHMMNSSKMYKIRIHQHIYSDENSQLIKYTPKLYTDIYFIAFIA